ncbi:hypothetical protein [Algicella marina]|uniref:Peptidase C58 YopT-type domain-containing protein n=1 Tax=Algicella marina TaxID=2683284 RepID=A0A6P1T4T2_9RHOB|nr:hypothetical protein [Algicella marina]QHQ36755.1 hypothetical protein GO499_17020 [Algicella marina]
MPAMRKAVVNGNNNINGLDGFDTAAAERLSGHGICSGITSSWMLALLNGVAEAIDTDSFVAYFNDVLRFQGGYLKDMGGRADDFFAQMNMKGLDTQIGSTGTVRTAELTIAHLPDSDTWAAYVALWGHAVGMAQKDGRFFLMDPNYGLFEYATLEEMVDMLNKGANARRRDKGKTKTDEMVFQFYS